MAKCSLFGNAEDYRDHLPCETCEPTRKTQEAIVYEAVQAALLNSECPPRAAVQEALRAAAAFAEGEDALPIAVSSSTDVEWGLRVAFLHLAAVAWDIRKRT